MLVNFPGEMLRNDVVHDFYVAVLRREAEAADGNFNEVE